MQGPQSSPGVGASKASSGQHNKQDNRQPQPDKLSEQAKPQDAAEADKLKGTSFTASTTLSLDTALGLYNMTQSQSFWELKQDTRCLVGWGSNTVVVAFRGTASMKNALADVQVTLSLPLCSVPLVLECNVGSNVDRRLRVSHSFCLFLAIRS